MRDLPSRLNQLWRAATGWLPPGPNGDSAHEPARLVYPSEPSLVYAVGDVHGRLDLLLRLEDRIAEDRARLQQPALLVLLGDLVDRGPASAQVLDHVLAPPPARFERLCLLGNHEAIMLSFIADPRPGAMWLAQGGRETLASYGIPPEQLRRPSRRLLTQLLATHVPERHLAFLRAMPVMLQTPRHVYVHAGIEPTVPLAEQSTDTLLWYRDDLLETYAGLGRRVVHGHSITRTPLVTEHRIAIDTGAFQTGTLTAVALAPGTAPRILSVSDSEGPCP
jgi:serine/threonine protein phosphatase 1